MAQRIAAETSGVDASAEFDGVGFCWIEQGAGQAGFASGYFYAEPEPKVGLPHSGKLWHWSKVLFEQYWLEKGVKHYMARWGLKLGAWFFRIPASL